MAVVASRRWRVDDGRRRGRLGDRGRSALVFVGVVGFAAWFVLAVRDRHPSLRSLGPVADPGDAPSITADHANLVAGDGPTTKRLSWRVTLIGDGRLRFALWETDGSADSGPWVTGSPTTRQVGHAGHQKMRC